MMHLAQVSVAMRALGGRMHPAQGWVMLTAMTTVAVGVGWRKGQTPVLGVETGVEGLAN
jgi:hypothetical protein